MTTLTYDSFARSAGTHHRPSRRAQPAPHTPAVAPPAAPLAVSAPAGARLPGRRAATIGLVAAIAALHGGAIVALSGGARTQPVHAPPAPIAIALVTPRVEPPPPPKPQVQPPRPKAVSPTPRPAAPRPAASPVAPSMPVVASDTPMVAASADTVQVATAPASVPAPPATAPVEKLTEPRGYAGYLNNPPPNYPAAAQKRGLEGQVVLKVHVLPSGHPDNVTVARSSGHAILDDAALKAVAQWTFDPARRGQTAVDGWVQVPLNFKI
ncbi:energy transducer TonB [Pseudoduganella sp. UC29_106]|uniref:energy transducer TonB n=1 Tax=Pseudoduganella sp. UC29_106 TaxID=3374553 RepID=UPI0037572B77